MRILILIAALTVMSVNFASSSRAYVCETQCNNNQYQGAGSAQCHTRCHN